MLLSRRRRRYEIVLCCPGSLVRLRRWLIRIRTDAIATKAKGAHAIKNIERSQKYFSALVCILFPFGVVVRIICSDASQKSARLLRQQRDTSAPSTVPFLSRPLPTLEVPARSTTRLFCRLLNNLFAQIRKCSY